ncbi:hypothetical protein [Corynebacterium hindlerae]|uniref:hypothetical protein n=1 Tax=Corynebacterium hindlerae TaxID=699041 RepID=UPI0031B7125E
MKKIAPLLLLLTVSACTSSPTPEPASTPADSAPSSHAPTGSAGARDELGSSSASINRVYSVTIEATGNAPTAHITYSASGTLVNIDAAPLPFQEKAEISGISPVMTVTLDNPGPDPQVSCKVTYQGETVAEVVDSSGQATCRLDTKKIREIDSR